MSLNCSFNVGCLNCLQFSAVINSPVMKIFAKKSLPAVLDDFLRVDYKNLNYHFKEMNIFKALSVLLETNSLSSTFHSPFCFLWILG